MIYDLDREDLIEKIGVIATDAIMDLRRQVEELREYHGVVRIAHTTGFKLSRNVAEGQACSDPQNKNEIANLSEVS